MRDSAAAANSLLQVMYVCSSFLTSYHFTIYIYFGIGLTSIMNMIISVTRIEAEMEL